VERIRSMSRANDRENVDRQALEALEGFGGPPRAFQQLNERSREVFRHVVDAFVETGEPVASRTIARRLGSSLSPATIRNVMADLEESGLLYAPHTSAGRLPTDIGLRLFVDGLLEIGDLSDDERRAIDSQCNGAGRSMAQVLTEASGVVAEMSRCVGLVIAPKSEAGLKHVEFVPLSENRALVILVDDNGMVENRVMPLPPGLPPAKLIEAGNYLSARLRGRTMDEARQLIGDEIARNSAEIDTLTARVVEQGLATWSGGHDDGLLIVSGQSRLLDNVSALSDIERIRRLMEALETKKDILRLLTESQRAEGVQIFIGSESALFGLSGCSVIAAPLTDQNRRYVGAIGVIGPTRVNYARIVPVVDYTAKLIGRLIG